MKKRTILLNVLTILLCIATCVGVTFAFFADSAISSNNKVQAGTLNVDLKLLEKNTTDKWNSIKKDNTPIFGEDVLWEPGYTDVKVLKVENNGNLAIEWEARIVLRGNLSELANVINVYLHPFAEGEAVEYPSSRGTLETWGTPITLNNYLDVNAQDFKSFLLNGTLEANHSTGFAIALQMDPEAGNEYQGLELGDFDIQIVATQLTHESDAFDENYDKNAQPPCAHRQTYANVLKDATPEARGEQNIVCKDCDTVIATEDVFLTFALATNGKYYRVTGITTDLGEDTDFVIPATYKSIPITAINQKAFQNNTVITSVVIPEGVTSIEKEAFDGCASLKSVIIPSSLTTVGANTFRNCSSLDTVTFAAGCQLTTITNKMFYGCSNLKGINLPDAITIIGDAAFSGCSSMQNFTISNNIESIANFVFEGCSNLQEVIIPDSITNIGDSAFRGCSSLQEIIIPDSVTSIGAGAFAACTSLREVTISDNVITIGGGMFSNCDNLTSVTIGNGITDIPNNMFYSCDSLENVTIPNGVKTIGDKAFYYCGKLTNITLPDDLTSIGAEAFWRTGLTSIVIPENVTKIGVLAFRSCKNLASVVLPKSLEEICEQAFLSSSIVSLTFKGDVDEWNAVVKGANWNYGISTDEVVCSNGTVTLN